jgi:hypothetical protein
MANYGERLVYWYLRLQGFCLVENFVLHRRTIDDKAIHTADADLLAIRLSGSCEEIDGERLDPEPWLAQELQFDTRHVALVVEVKTGSTPSAGQAFDRERILYALKFLGVPGRPVDNIANALTENATTLAGSYWLVGKLLITESPAPITRQPYLQLSLDNALRFIDQRLTLHADRKRADRLFFPDELMQFLAWRRSIE